MRIFRSSLLVLIAILTPGCVERLLFPVFDAELLIPNPGPLGPYATVEKRIEWETGGDGDRLGATAYLPADAQSPCPVMLWVLGVNNRAHYHQSFHECLASRGCVSIVPDTRDISFVDFRYHSRNIENALFVLDKALAGEMGFSVDATRVASGGYSIGGTMAAMAAGRDARISSLVLWAPAPAPTWLGATPKDLLPQVKCKALFVLGEKDIVAPLDEWPKEMRGMMSAADIAELIIPEGVHLFFQQPSGVDDRNPPTDITRREQQEIAIRRSLEFLDLLSETE